MTAHFTQASPITSAANQGSDAASNRAVCPVCAAAELHPIREHVPHGAGGPPYHLFECAACRVQHWQPLIHPDRDYYEGETMTMYAGMHEGRRRPNDPRFAKFLAQFARARAGRHLDVGCSDGVLLEAMRTAGHEVWGLDIDRKALEAAKRRGLSNVFCLGVDEFIAKAKAERLSFSIITAFDVLEHLVDPVGTLRGLATLLEPGGYLVGTVPNRDRILVNQVKSDFPPHHFFRFDRRSIAGCLEQAGLAVEKVEVFQYGYSMNTALGVLLGKGPNGPRRGARGRADAKTDGSAAAASSPPVRVRRKRLRTLRRAAGAALLAALAVPSYLLERPRRRGFKLYFVARRGPADGS